MCVPKRSIDRVKLEREYIKNALSTGSLSRGRILKQLSKFLLSIPETYNSQKKIQYDKNEREERFQIRSLFSTNQNSEIK